jgi:hypothetical protein
MPTSSSAPGASSNSCAPGSAALSAISAARSRAIARSRTALAAARCRAAGPPSGAAPARAQGLLASRPRGGVRRQRQGPGALRVRPQGLDCHPGHRAQGRAVRAARQGAARQPLCTLGPVIAIWKSSQVLRCVASTATRAIAATTVPIGSRSGSTARSSRVT